MIVPDMLGNTKVKQDNKPWFVGEQKKLIRPALLAMTFCKTSMNYIELHTSFYYYSQQLLSSFKKSVTWLRLSAPKTYFLKVIFVVKESI